MFHVEQVAVLARVMEGKKSGGLIARLLFTFRKIDRASKDSWRGTSLESLQLDTSI